MPHSGSVFSTSSNTFCDARYQKECWYSMARLNCFCASGLHDVSKRTLPSLLSSACAWAGWQRATLIASATAGANEPNLNILRLPVLENFLRVRPVCQDRRAQALRRPHFTLREPYIFPLGTLCYRLLRAACGERE